MDGSKGFLIYLLLFSLFILFVLLVVLFVLRAYFRAQKKALKAQRTSEMGFVLDTFHGLVSTLKDKGQGLEVLRRLAEERAVIVEGYNENILESVPSGVISLDETMKITKINSAGQRILAINREDVIGRDLKETTLGQLSRLLDRDIERGQTQYVTERGKRLYLGFSLTPLLNAKGKPIGKLFVFTDLTELKALEAQAELRKRLSSLGEMAAGIAHELRNPMGVIAGYTKLLERQVEGSLKKTVDAISKEVSLMDTIINEFLSFAKPGELNISEVNLRNIISASTESILLKNPNILLSNEVSSDITIKGDEILLKQACTNLIQNSIEAKGETIRFSAIHEPDSVAITVSDTGHGIPPAIRDKIFLPFYTTKEKGTGLGLAIVHRIISLHGGSIEVIDSPQGASFRIKLPD
ncbi:MAG: PAS domain-containing protein [Nitrospirae bacterium]|nr:PAS domain-containing protein [Nitrospirota bacterium]